MIFTGSSGEQYGYADGPNGDGTFWYTGEGQVGDMRMVSGNRAVRDHETAGKALHLFEALGSRNRGFVQHVSEARYIDHHEQLAPDRNGTLRRALVFRLELLSSDKGVPPASVADQLSAHPGGLWSLPMRDLYQRAVSSARDSSSSAHARIVYERAAAVKVYVLRRATGVCEGCSTPAPFVTRDGRPYLEPHHTRRRADGGPDNPNWVIALCPTCHKRVHYGIDGDDYNKQLIARLTHIVATEAHS